MKVELVALVALVSAVCLPLALASWSEPASDSSHANHGEAHTARVRPPASDHSYSLFMHHVSGMGVLVLSILLFADRLSGDKSRLLRGSIGLLWVSLGTFLMVKADPEGWPIGPATFMESLSMPTANEWVQHKLLSLIPVLFGLGVFAVELRRGAWAQVWQYAFVLASVLGAGGLLWHQHAAHPGMDLVNVQHRFFALTAMFIAMALVLERWLAWGWKYKRLLLPAGLSMLGLQLLLFEE
jgi:putative copper resistance protein D